MQQLQVEKGVAATTQQLGEGPKGTAALKGSRRRATKLWQLGEGGMNNNTEKGGRRQVDLRRKKRTETRKTHIGKIPELDSPGQPYFTRLSARRQKTPSVVARVRVVRSGCVKEIGPPRPHVSSLTQAGPAELLLRRTMIPVLAP
ncbi:hypothetical protein CRG98_004937 [Punica granatum]|uniref:Uncharacterized protein n=1 Tax=Punica granatum TaxID=22663 RepID=A0A2I0L1X2_PUNGR|nr:hypothetical protein CRG98_004937 [Punica granatum]